MIHCKVLSTLKMNILSLFLTRLMNLYYFCIQDWRGWEEFTALTQCRVEERATLNLSWRPGCLHQHASLLFLLKQRMFFFLPCSVQLILISVPMANYFLVLATFCYLTCLSHVQPSWQKPLLPSSRKRYLHTCCVPPDFLSSPAANYEDS